MLCSLSASPLCCLVRCRAAWLLPLVAFSFGAQATEISLGVASSTQVPDAWVARVLGSSLSQLQSSSTFELRRPLPLPKGTPRRCEGNCVEATASQLPNRSGFIFNFKGDPKSERIATELSFVFEGEILSTQRAELTPEGYEPALRGLLDKTLPAWSQRGFGGVKILMPPSAVAKIDGRLQNTSSWVALPSGKHSIDVVYAKGNAWLQVIDVAEGQRRTIDVRVTPAILNASQPRAGLSALRVASYVTFMTGAVLTSVGLLAGALAKNSASGIRPCEADSRSCSELAVAEQRAKESQRFATIGNVMFGLGLGTMAIGGGLFTLDLVAP
jgi:hypothetical protein